MVLNILIIALGFIFLGALFSNIIIAANRQKRLAQIYFVGTIFNVIANLIFIPKYSYFGAAATTVATELLVTSLMVYVIYKTINFIPSFLRILFKALLASLLMVLVLYYFSYLNIFYLVLIGVAVYLPVIYFIGGISKEEVRRLMKRG
jgi:O-antigen/teichoic acid export membrane protein